MDKKNIGVYICAYNEEQNIENLLRNIFNLDQNEAYLKRVLLISDGSTDNTIEAARKIDDPRLEIRDYKENRGLTACVNEAIGSFNTEILIKMDADLITLPKDTLLKFNEASKDNSTGAICPIFETMTERNNLISKAHRRSKIMWGQMKNLDRDKYDVHFVVGHTYGLTKEVYSDLNIPPDVKSREDCFAGLWVKYKDKKIKIIDDLIIKTLEEDDFKTLINRYSRNLDDNFGNVLNKEFLKKELPNKKDDYSKVFFKNLLRHPIETSIYLIMRNLAIFKNKLKPVPVKWK